MLGLATGRYTILRGVPTTNDYGDEINTDTPIAEDVLGSVVEQTFTDFDHSDNRLVTVSKLTGRFTHGTDIKEGDRIVDKNGTTYLVDTVRTGAQLFGKPDVVLDLTYNR